MTPVCSTFVESATELALGSLDGRQREELLAHAAVCPPCQAHLDSLMLVTDRLLLLSPEIEPPPGFESRVLDRTALAGASNTPAPLTAASMTTASMVARGRGRDHRRRWRVALAVAAAGVVVASGVAFAAARHTPAPEHAVEQGAIIRIDGTQSGQVRLLDRPRPMVVVMIDKPRRFNGRVTCELVGADGTTTVVGTWSADDIANGVWAVGISADLLRSVRMIVRDPQGALASSADLH